MTDMAANLISLFGAMIVVFFYVWLSHCGIGPDMVVCLKDNWQ